MPKSAQAWPRQNQGDPLARVVALIGVEEPYGFARISGKQAPVTIAAPLGVLFLG